MEAMIPIGVMRFPTPHPVDIALVARKSEVVGCDSLWLGEHSIMPVQSAAHFPGSPDGVIPTAYSGFVDPFVARARASAVNTRLKLGTGIPLVPERNPRLCRQFAFLRQNPKILYWKINDMQA
jgi:alkanesulfonate monooxygenase SsuD/methylene tetrahydromethanopterin reductase-like flavin-dependent oxidoreductase (luciferase family)